MVSKDRGEGKIGEGGGGKDIATIRQPGQQLIECHYLHYLSTSILQTMGTQLSSISTTYFLWLLVAASSSSQEVQKVDLR